MDADEVELEDSELSEDDTTEEELSIEIGEDIFFCSSEELIKDTIRLDTIHGTKKGSNLVSLAAK